MNITVVLISSFGSEKWQSCRFWVTILWIFTFEFSKLFPPKKWPPVGRIKFFRCIVKSVHKRAEANRTICGHQELRNFWRWNTQTIRFRRYYQDKRHSHSKSVDFHTVLKFELPTTDEKSLLSAVLLQIGIHSFAVQKCRQFEKSGFECNFLGKVYVFLHTVRIQTRADCDGESMKNWSV